MLKWLWDASDPQLDGDERLVLDSIGALNRGVLSAQGRMILTTKRLVYLPVRLRFMRRLSPFDRTDIPLDRINGVRFGSWKQRLLGGLHGLPVVVLLLRDGGELAFQTGHARTWKETLERIIDTSSD